MKKLLKNKYILYFVKKIEILNKIFEIVFTF